MIRVDLTAAEQAELIELLEQNIEATRRVLARHIEESDCTDCVRRMRGVLTEEVVRLRLLMDRLVAADRIPE